MMAASMAAISSPKPTSSISTRARSDFISLAPFVGEPVADAAHREHVARLGRIDLDLGAQPVDVRIHVVLVALERGPPYGVEQLHAREGPPGVAGEVCKQVELLGRERHWPAVDSHLAARAVDLQLADLDSFFIVR